MDVTARICPAHATPVRRGESCPKCVEASRKALPPSARVDQPVEPPKPPTATLEFEGHAITITGPKANDIRSRIEYALLPRDIVFHKRVPVAGDVGWAYPETFPNAKPPGTVTWEEHYRAYQMYAHCNPDIKLEPATEFKFDHTGLTKYLGNPPYSYKPTSNVDLAIRLYRMCCKEEDLKYTPLEERTGTFKVQKTRYGEMVEAVIEVEDILKQFAQNGITVDPKALDECPSTTQKLY